MQKVLFILYKILKNIVFYIRYNVGNVFSRFLFYLNKINIGESFQSMGLPYVSLSRGGKGTIGNNFRMHNILSGNPIGRSHKCVFVIGPKGVLTIGDNVGISFTAINCQKHILIKDNVVIGGGCCIYDSDFHPLDVGKRNSKDQDSIKIAEVIIEENVFIGANSTILKGVTIGMNSIIGACSVITKNIPTGEIWAGNPAVFIRKI